MNTLMVHVTDILTAHQGDEVTLFGKQGSGEITKGEIEEINGAYLPISTLFGLTPIKKFWLRTRPLISSGSTS